MQTSIVRLSAALHDPVMRMRRCAEFLSKASPAVVVITGEQAALKPARTEQRIFYTSLIHLLLTIRPRPPLPAGPLPLTERELLPTAERFAELIEMAGRLNAVFVRTLFSKLMEEPDSDDVRTPLLDLTIEHISLGVRRERARSSVRGQFEPLLVDQTPSVVQLLAANPRVREDDVVRMAARRPNHPYTLWSMLLHHRWLASARVREAVAMNPYSRPWLTLALAPLVGSQVLLHALAMTRLPDEILEAMLPLHDGACAQSIGAIMEAGEPEMPTMTHEIEESYEDAAAYFGPTDANGPSDDEAS